MQSLKNIFYINSKNDSDLPSLNQILLNSSDEKLKNIDKKNLYFLFSDKNN